MAGARGRRGWVRQFTPPKHLSADPEPCTLCPPPKCRQCGIPSTDPICPYCVKAREAADWIEANLQVADRESVRMLPWQVMVLSRWFRHSEQTGDTHPT